MKKRILATVLSLVVMFGMSTPVFAAYSPDEGTTEYEMMHAIAHVTNLEEDKVQIGGLTGEELAAGNAAADLFKSDAEVLAAADLYLEEGVTAPSTGIQIKLDIEGVTAEDNGHIFVAHQKADGSWEYIQPDRVTNGYIIFTMTNFSPVVVARAGGEAIPGNAYGANTAKGVNDTAWENAVPNDQVTPGGGSGDGGNTSGGNGDGGNTNTPGGNGDGGNTNTPGGNGDGGNTNTPGGNGDGGNTNTPGGNGDGGNTNTPGGNGDGGNTNTPGGNDDAGIIQLLLARIDSLLELLKGQKPATTNNYYTNTANGGAATITNPAAANGAAGTTAPSNGGTKTSPKTGETMPVWPIAAGVVVAGLAVCGVQARKYAKR